MTAKLRIKGARELDRVLAKLPAKARKRVLPGAVRAGAQIIRKAAAASAPVRSGGLRDSVGVVRKRRGVTASVTFKVGPKTPVFHGIFAEFGTRHSPATPFLRPAFDGNKVAALDKIGERLAKGIEREALKIAGPLRKSGLLK